VPLEGGSNRIELPEALSQFRLRCLERARTANAGRTLLDGVSPDKPGLEL
jgi:hypothetical protein